MGGETQLLKRIPRIKFPQRHPKPSSLSGSSSTSHIEQATGNDAYKLWTRSSSEVPASPQNTAAGGKASLQPKRTPVTDREIEAVMEKFVGKLKEDHNLFNLWPLRLCDLFFWVVALNNEAWEKENDEKSQV